MVSSHSGFSGTKLQIQLFYKDFYDLMHSSISSLNFSLSLSCFICSFCCWSSSFISICSCLDSRCSWLCPSSNYSYSSLSLRRCSYENNMVSSLTCNYYLSCLISIIHPSFSLTSQSSLFFIWTIFSRSYFSSLQMLLIFGQFLSNSSILALALASSSYFLRKNSLHLANFTSYSYLILAYLFQNSSNLANFFLLSAAVRLELLRCWVSLQFFYFSSLSNMIRCSFASISRPSWSESTLTSVCWRSIFFYRYVTASASFNCSISHDFLVEEGGSAMISLRTCLTRLLDFWELITITLQNAHHSPYKYRKTGNQSQCIVSHHFGKVAWLSRYSSKQYSMSISCPPTGAGAPSFGPTNLATSSLLFNILNILP